MMESDGDDPSEDIVVVDENIMLLGPKLLDKPPHIELSNRNSRVEPCLSMSVPVGLVSRRGTRIIITDKENQETNIETSQENA